MSATRRLAAYAVETRYEDLPADVVKGAKRAIRDSLGCLLGGTTLTLGRKVRDVILSQAGPGKASVAGVERKAAPPLASHINAQLSNLLDFDDTMTEGDPGHPAATIVPAALAMAEMTGAKGKEFLTAVVVGYDVYNRIARAGKPSVGRSKQVRGMATWQVFGAAAAAAHILRLDAEAAARAFGLAALHAPVPFVGKIYEERPMWALKNNFGWATLGGVLGALYAAQGLDANHEILERETGFWAMAGSDRCDYSLLDDQLGSYYAILSTAFKPYPCCRYTHSALDALGQIVGGGQIDAGEIRQVTIFGNSKIRVFEDYRPRTCIDSEFSLPYLAALVILGVTPGYAWLEEERRNDPAVLSLADRVRLEVDPQMEGDMATGKIQARVSLLRGNGTREEASVSHARGDPLNPLSEGELREKFMKLVEPLLGPSLAGEFDSQIGHLDEIPDIEDISVFLREARPPAA